MHKACVKAAAPSRHLPLRLVFLAGLLVMMTATAALAHHGWRWTTGEMIELTGTIEAVRLGNPHGEVEVSTGEETWLVEVGQPWRNERAGLTDDMFAVGNEMTFVGEPAADMEERRLKAVRVIFEGRNFDLYPGRL